MIRYWIQHADLAVEEFDQVHASQAIKAVQDHDWAWEIRKCIEGLASGEECCSPGIGLLADDGRFLNIRFLSRGECYFFYGPRKPRVLGVILFEPAQHCGKFNASDNLIPELIERFFDADHYWLVGQASSNLEVPSHGTHGRTTSEVPMFFGFALSTVLLVVDLVWIRESIEHHHLPSILWQYAALALTAIAVMAAVRAFDLASTANRITFLDDRLLVRTRNAHHDLHYSGLSIELCGPFSAVDHLRNENLLLYTRASRVTVRTQDHSSAILICEFEDGQMLVDHLLADLPQQRITYTRGFRPIRETLIAVLVPSYCALAVGWMYPAAARVSAVFAAVISFIWLGRVVLRSLSVSSVFIGSSAVRIRRRKIDHEFAFSDLEFAGYALLTPVGSFVLDRGLGGHSHLMKKLHKQHERSLKEQGTSAVGQTEPGTPIRLTTRMLSEAIKLRDSGKITTEQMLSVFQEAIDNGDILESQNEQSVIAVVLPLVDSGELRWSLHLEEFETRNKE